MTSFFLIDNVSVSVRNAIAREIVSNILVHREFSTAFPAKLVVEPDKIYTENWNRAQRVGTDRTSKFHTVSQKSGVVKFLC